ncbi:MAG: YciI family protein [Candidatus Promineifilaceae bacterium]|nr:YciI family protein [Candidatus Promineifilaceae bacterium]
MQYMLLIYQDEAAQEAMGEEELNEQMAGYNAFTEEVRERDVLVSGDALHPTSAATTVRVRDGRVLTTDGPFAETKEQLGGFYILDCENLDEAIELAAKIPGAKEGSVEIRPIVVWE